MSMFPIPEPLVIDAIRCRLWQDVKLELCPLVAVPAGEMLLILEILAAARAVVREYAPDADEHARGAGTGVGMRAAEDRLIAAVKSGVPAWPTSPSYPQLSDCPSLATDS